MPMYEFMCQDCQQSFSKRLSVVDYQEGGVVCPNCNSENVEQVPSSFFAVTSRKTA